MQKKQTAQSVIASYRKRQQMGPLLLGGMAVLLVVIGLFILIIYLTGEGKPAFTLFKTKTPTPTETATVTPTLPTSTPSMTPTVTETPLPPTASAPFEYIVQENDSCYSIAEKYGIQIDILLVINPSLTFDCLIQPGDKIWVPNPDMEMPTATPFPSDMPAGTRITYVVVTGDYLGLIAAKFRSTEAQIIKVNNLVSPYTLYPGQELIIPVNIATMTPTKPATRTYTPGGPIVPGTETKTPSVTPSPTQ